MKLTRAVDRWIEWPSLDYLVTLAVAAIILVLQPSDPVAQEQRGTWLQTLAAVDGGFLGVAGIAVTLLFTVTPNDRLERVFATVGPRLSKLVLSGIGGLSAGTIGFAALFLIEGWPEPERLAAAAALSAFSLARLARLWWLIRQIALVLAVPNDIEPQPPVVDATPWVRPEVGDDDYALGTRPVRRANDPDPSE